METQDFGEDEQARYRYGTPSLRMRSMDAGQRYGWTIWWMIFGGGWIAIAVPIAVIAYLHGHPASGHASSHAAKAAADGIGSFFTTLINPVIHLKIGMQR